MEDKELKKILLSEEEYRYLVDMSVDGLYYQLDTIEDYDKATNMAKMWVIFGKLAKLTYKEKKE